MARAGGRGLASPLLSAPGFGLSLGGKLPVLNLGFQVIFQRRCRLKDWVDGKVISSTFRVSLNCEDGPAHLVQRLNYAEVKSEAQKYSALPALCGVSPALTSTP